MVPTSSWEATALHGPLEVAGSVVASAGQAEDGHKLLSRFNESVSGFSDAPSAVSEQRKLAFASSRMT